MSYKACAKLDMTDRLRFAARTLAEHNHFLRAVLRAQGAHENDIDDLLQDLFLCLIVEPIPQEHVTRRYLYRAVVNDFIDLKRMSHRHRELLRRAGKRLNADLSRAPDHRLVTEDEMNQLLGIIEQRLPPCHAQAVVLRHVDGLDTCETAKQLGVNPRTASHYISAGLKRVREFLRERTGHQ